MWPFKKEIPSPSIPSYKLPPPLKLGPINILIDDLANAAGIDLPRMTPEIFRSYDSRLLWVEGVIKKIKEASYVAVQEDGE